MPTPPIPSATASDDLQQVDRLCDDFESSWRSGTPPSIEIFLNRVPETARSAAFVELLLLDLSYRRDDGMTPRAEDYLGRFPEYVAAIREAFAVPEGSSAEARAGSSAGSPTSGAPELTSLPDLPPRIGDYELLGELGRGGMGVVFKARQISLDRIVALKIIRGDGLLADEYVRRFQSEARAAARLQHPGIVQVYDVGRDGPYHFFSMEFVDGRTLSDSCEHGLPPHEQTASWLRDVAAAVHVAHENGVLHRDLKPSNVLVDAVGRVRIADFGLAKLAAGTGTLTATGQVLGTPGYMAPEQARGEHERIDRRCDVYSLGAVLYALLTGRPPFRGRSPIETMVKVLHEEPTPPRELDPAIPTALERICLRCLRKEPDERYETADALRTALERFLAGESDAALDQTTLNWAPSKSASASATMVEGAPAAAARSEPTRDETAARLRRRLWMLAAVVASVAAIGALSALVLRDRHRDPIGADRPAVASPAADEAHASPPGTPGSATESSRNAPPPGALDPTFGEAGVVRLKLTEANGLNDAYAIALQPDGKIVAAGQCPRKPNAYKMAVTRHLPDGRLDPSFNGTGSQIVWFGSFDDGVAGRNLLIQPDGKIVIGGRADVTAVRYDFGLVRLHPDGTFDEAFGEKGTLTTDVAGQSTAYLHALALQPDGRIVATGNVMSKDTKKIEFAVVRYLPEGAVDTKFGKDGRTYFEFPGKTEQVSAAAVRADGKIIVAGRAGPLEDYRPVVLRLTSDGQPDETFGEAGRVTLEVGPKQAMTGQIALQGERVLVLFGDNVDQRIVRLNDDGTVDPSFGTRGDGTALLASQCAGFALDEDGAIIAADGARGRMYVFDADGKPRAEYGRPAANGADTTAANADSRGATGPSPSLRDMIRAPDGRFVFCGLLHLGADNSDWYLERRIGPPRGARTALGPRPEPPEPPPTHPGALDPSFGKGGSVQTTLGQGGGVNDAYAVAVQSDGKIVVAGQSSRGRDTYYVAITRHMPDGQLDRAFRGGKLVAWFGTFDDGIRGRNLLIQPDGKIVYGGRAEVSSEGYDFGLGRLNADGEWDKSFGRNGTVTTNVTGTRSADLEAMALQPDGKILAAGNATIAPGDLAFALMRYLPNGDVDASFGKNGRSLVNFPGTREEVTVMLVAPDGKIVFAGRGGVREGAEDYEAVIVRHTADGLPDATFGKDGRVTYNAGVVSSSANQIALQDRKLLVQFGGDNHHRLLRLNDDGALDPTFGPTKEGFYEHGRSFVGFVVNDDRTIAVVEGNSGRVAVLSADGLPVAHYGPEGSTEPTGPQPVLREVIRGPDGKFVFVGNVRMKDGECDWFVQRRLGLPEMPRSKQETDR